MSNQLRYIVVKYYRTGHVNYNRNISVSPECRKEKNGRVNAVEKTIYRKNLVFDVIG